MAIDHLPTKVQVNSRQKPEMTLDADYQYCREVMLGASKNYSFASRFLPREKRHHVEALYAFLRVGDDRVDVSHNGFSSRKAAIEDWERVYWRAFSSGSSPHPVMRAYLNTAIECDIPADTMIPYFRAMKEDLTITRFEKFSDLLHYMEGSAMTVGRGMMYIMGIQPGLGFPEVTQYADALSIAMQLSNFWRDIAYDWSIGRVYLPQEDLHRFGVTEDDLAAKRVTPQFIDLMEFEIQRTEAYFSKAKLGVSMLAAGQWGIMSGLEIYRAILTGIRRSRYDVYHTKAGASDLNKLGLVINAWWHTRAS